MQKILFFYAKDFARLHSYLSYITILLLLFTLERNEVKKSWFGYQLFLRSD